MRDDELSLREHHAALEDRFQQLLARLAEDDPISFRCDWLLFERELEEHMTLEERELLPLLGRNNAAEAELLREQHNRIRTRLAKLAIAVDLHTLRTDDVATFVQTLQEHARREDLLLYPLAAAAGHRSLSGLRRRLSSLSTRLTNALRPDRSLN